MTQLPRTVRLLEVEANQIHTIAGRALKEAKKQVKGGHWSSLVLLIERLDDSEAPSPG